MTQLALVIDLNVCVGCHACVTSCKEWNTSGSAGPLCDERPYEADPTGTFFNRVQTFEIGKFPNSETLHFPKSCLHCEDPPCVPVCPTGASYKRKEDGIVLVDYDKCIGCKYCTWACPYGAREIDEKQKVMKKCTLCVDRIYDQSLAEIDRKPSCVKACPTSARMFGDIHDPESAVSLAIREEGGYALMPEWGTHPANHYLPRRKTKLKIHKDELERADNPLKIEGHLPKPGKGESSMDDVSALVRRTMKPAFSVLFLTTLLGAGQGLFLALFTHQTYSLFGLLPMQSAAFYGYGSVLALLFLMAGLLASFFHLGRPERAWRSATQWRTSWLSREVIVLPALMGVVFLYAASHLTGYNPTIVTIPGGLVIDLSVVIGIVGTFLAFALFVCTGMIYACLRFLREWNTPLTVINYILMGGSSGFILAAVYSASTEPSQTNFFAGWAIIITVLAFLGRAASLVRNARLKPKSTMQTAIGVKHPYIVQRSMGMMGGAFNTREYFHGKSQAFLRAIKPAFLLLAFVAPLMLLAFGIYTPELLGFVFILQYFGLLAERWFFFAQANHPQNLYYQTIG